MTLRSNGRFLTRENGVRVYPWGAPGVVVSFEVRRFPGFGVTPHMDVLGEPVIERA